jgi:uncharacterized membrane protein
MVNLIAAAAYFLLIHLLVSGTRLRDAITGRIGEGPYMGLFAAASIAGLVWMGFAFAFARGGPGDAVWWDVTPATRIVQIVLQLIAFLLIVPGLATRNPTAVRQGAKVEDPNIVKGMLRITRHPFLWGVAIWAAGHILVNGDAASLVLFGSLLFLALLGTLSIDAKRRRALGETWDTFATQTSNIPFGAIAAGRQKLNLAEIGWARIAAAVAVWAVLLFAHPYLFGVRALP